jgi:hypothetical protein
MRLLPVLACALSIVSAQAAPAPKKSPAWTAAKADAQRWRDNLLAGVAKTGQYDVASFQKTLDEAWRIAARIEGHERTLHLKRIKAVPEQKKLSREIMELNLLYVYGNILPRILDESTELAPGRAYAGGDLKVAISETDFRAREAAQRVGAEFPEKLMPLMAE